MSFQVPALLRMEPVPWKYDFTTRLNESLRPTLLAARRRYASSSILIVLIRALNRSAPS